MPLKCCHTDRKKESKKRWISQECFIIIAHNTPTPMISKIRQPWWCHQRVNVTKSSVTNWRWKKLWGRWSFRRQGGMRLSSCITGNRPFLTGQNQTNLKLTVIILFLGHTEMRRVVYQIKYHVPNCLEWIHTPFFYLFISMSCTQACAQPSWVTRLHYKNSRGLWLRGRAGPLPIGRSGVWSPVLPVWKHPWAR